jgi:hypothetical protein
MMGVMGYPLSLLISPHRFGAMWMGWDGMGWETLFWYRDGMGYIVLVQGWDGMGWDGIYDPGDIRSRLAHYSCICTDECHDIYCSELCA